MSGIGLLLPGEKELDSFEGVLIKRGEWHQFMAWTDCLILEIQFGSDVREDDIERV